jgi:hypothetical protein
MSLGEFLFGRDESMRQVLAAMALAAQVACATTPLETARETAIPLVRANGVLEWRAASDRVVHIRGFDGQWYQARTMAACPRLLAASALSYEVNGPDELDRHGSLLVEGWRCALVSVTRSESPAPQNKK